MKAHELCNAASWQPSGAVQSAAIVVALCRSKLLPANGQRSQRLQKSASAGSVRRQSKRSGPPRRPQVRQVMRASYAAAMMMAIEPQRGRAAALSQTRKAPSRSLSPGRAPKSKALQREPPSTWNSSPRSAPQQRPRLTLQGAPARQPPPHQCSRNRLPRCRRRPRHPPRPPRAGEPRRRCTHMVRLQLARQRSGSSTVHNWSAAKSGRPPPTSPRSIRIRAQSTLLV